MKAAERDIIQRAFRAMYPMATITVRPQNLSKQIPNSMVIIQGGVNWVLSYTMTHDERSGGRHWTFLLDGSKTEVIIPKEER